MCKEKSRRVAYVDLGGGAKEKLREAMQAEAKGVPVHFLPVKARHGQAVFAGGSAARAEGLGQACEAAGPDASVPFLLYMYERSGALGQVAEFRQAVGKKKYREVVRQYKADPRAPYDTPEDHRAHEKGLHFEHALEDAAEEP